MSSQFFPLKWNVSLGKPEVLDGIVVAWNDTSLPPKAELCSWTKRNDFPWPKRIFFVLSLPAVTGDLGCFLTRKRLGRDHRIQVPKVSWHFIADGLEKSPVKLSGWLQNPPHANIDINECAVGLFHQNDIDFVSWIFGTPASLASVCSWMPPIFPADIGHFNLN